LIELIVYSSIRIFRKNLLALISIELQSYVVSVIFNIFYIFYMRFTIIKNHNRKLNLQDPAWTFWFLF